MADIFYILHSTGNLKCLRCQDLKCLFVDFVFEFDFPDAFQNYPSYLLIEDSQFERTPPNILNDEL